MGTEELIRKLHRDQTLSEEEWIQVIDGRTPKAAEYLFRLAGQVRHAVSTAVSAGAIPTSAATGLRRMRSWTAAARAMGWACAHLCSRAGRTVSSRTSG